MAEYPTGVKSFTAINDGDVVADEMWEDISAEVTAMQQALLSTGFEHNLFPESSGDARSLGTSSKFWGLAYLKGVTLTDASELTVSTGAITVTQGYHRVDTESDAASDDLATITAGSGVTAGFLLILRAEDVSRVVTVKDGTGNLLLADDYALSATDRTITLIYDGTNWREVCRSITTDTTSPVRVLNRDVAVNDVVNSNTETTVYTFTVPGGTLGSTKALRLTLIGDYLNNSGSSRTLTIKGKYGSTTVFSGVPGGSITADANRHAVFCQLVLHAFNATNAQVASGTVTLGAANTIGGTAAASAATFFANHSTVAEDSTGDLALAVTVQHSATDANLSFRAQTAVLEVLD